MFIFQKKYQPSLIIAAAVHFVLFFFLFTVFAFNSSLPYVVKSGNAQQPIVQAVAVNQQQVQRAVQQLQAQQEAQQRSQVAKQQAQAEHLKQMQQQATAAKYAQEQALKNLQQLKANQQKLQAQQQLEQQQAAQRLAALKQQQTQQQQKVAQQKQHLAQLEQQQQTATQNYKLQQQKLAALQQKQQTMATQKNLQSQDAKDLLKQELQQEQSQLNQAKTAYIQGIVNKYNALVIQSIYQNWFIPPNTNPKLSVKLQVNVAQGGAVSNVTVLQTSGDNALDQSAVMAVYKASPLPIPTKNPAVYKQFQQFSITMTPSEISDVG